MLSNKTNSIDSLWQYNTRQISRQTDRQADRHTSRQTDTQADRQTSRQTDTQADRQAQ